MIDSSEITENLIQKYVPPEIIIEKLNDGLLSNDKPKNSKKYSFFFIFLFIFFLFKKKESTPFYKFLVLFQRSTKEIMRNPSTSVAKFVQSVFIAVLMGLIYLRLDNYQDDISNRQGVLFFVAM